MHSLAAAINDLPIDNWRREHPFSPELSDAQRALFESRSDTEASDILTAWLSNHQPCLFGRIAAKEGLLRFCFLREADIADDHKVRNKIQLARTAWKRDAWDGHAHGFVIVLVSERIATAAPSLQLLEVAKSVCAHYLLVTPVPDQIYLDELYFELPVRPNPVRRWPVGVNYFCANGEGRWWHDHRIPGGLALSMNSVGHMAAVGRAASALEAASVALGLSTETIHDGKVTSPVTIHLTPTMAHAAA
jgi:hypothetical protein